MELKGLVSKLSLLAVERETIINTNDEMETYHIYSRQKNFINKMIKMGYEPIKTDIDTDGVMYSAEFEIPLNRMTIKKKDAKTRTYTDEQREASRNRMLEMNKSKGGN